MTRAVDLGIAALVLAVGVAILVAVGSVPSALALLASDALVLALGGLAVAAGVGTLYRTRTAEQDAGTAAEAVAAATPLGSDRESPDADGGGRSRWNGLGNVIAGRSWEGNREYVDETFRRALERPDVDIGRRAGADLSHYRREARSSVVETAVAVLSRRHDVDEADAATMIREGRWTDDPRAAAFLEGSVRLPLRIRLVDWLYGRRYRRGLEAAVREIERIAAGGALERDRDAPSGRDADLEAPLEGETVVSADDYGTEAWHETIDDGTAPAGANGPNDAGGSTDRDAVSGSRPVDPVGDLEVGPPSRRSRGTEFGGGERR